MQHVFLNKWNATELIENKLPGGDFVKIVNTN